VEPCGAIAPSSSLTSSYSSGSRRRSTKSPSTSLVDRKWLCWMGGDNVVEAGGVTT